MSHDLEMVNGEGQAMYRKPAWHALGEVVGDHFGWLDAVASNLTITMPVKKVPMGDLILASHTAQADEYGAVRSDGRILKSGLGEQWTAFHAEAGYEFGQAIRNQASAQALAMDLEALGTIDHGRKWFMTFNLGDFSIGDYSITDYLSVNGSYDSTWPLQVLSSPIVQVCANTIALSQKSGMTHYRFKHTSGIFDRVEEASRALRRHRTNREVLEALGNTLIRTPITAGDFQAVMNDLFPLDDTTETKLSTKAKNANEEARDKVQMTWLHSPYVSDRNNAWAVVQAVNTFENWGQTIRKTKGQGEATTRALRQVQALNNGGQDLTQRAVEMLKVLA